ncbi:MAG TPA: hypothetical protein VGS58_20360 [Candidatus Sulfopaludibacter sp.]|nr:hypothetical protein [Candidatus Sulfopaludibacter sp.]
MKSILSKFVLAPAVLAAAVLATSSAKAETTIKVPFNFTAAGQVCPAGYYTVTRNDNTNFVTLSRKGTAQSFTYVIGPGAPGPNDTKIALKFDNLAGTHVLQSIQYGSRETSRLDKKALRDMEHESQLTGGR